MRSVSSVNSASEPSGCQFVQGEAQLAECLQKLIRIFTSLVDALRPKFGEQGEVR